MNTSRHKSHPGFTLIELSIVLVIIGLIVGGVLVGQDLIRAAGVRATVAQIEKYNTAVNTFRGKYNALPGDLNAAVATQFGFIPRGTGEGEGDGNGVLEGNNFGGAASGTLEATGETPVFWVDLSQVNLIDGTYTGASETVAPGGGSGVPASGLAAWFPQAKLGGGNFVYVFSYNSVNYFGLSGITHLDGANMYTTPALSVQQAYGIDSKIDDGLPQSGNVLAGGVATGGAGWVDEGGYFLVPNSDNAVAGSSTTCEDNGNAVGVLHYSVEMSNGSNVTCALSFRFQ